MYREEAVACCSKRSGRKRTAWPEGDRRMPEKVLIENCSPTLAGIKPASLVSLRYESREQANEDIRKMNREIFVAKGLCAVPLRYSKDSVLLLIYRPAALEKRLADGRVREYLEQYGYVCSSIARCISKLSERICECSEFPHEIGIFLGYPLGDVIGFTQHRDTGCKCTGYWKVYGDEVSAQRTFARYRACTACYLRSWRKGASMDSLTVRL